MLSLHFALTALAILTPAFSAVVVRRKVESRKLAIATSAATLLLVIAAAFVPAVDNSWLRMSGLAAAPSIVLAAAACAVFVASAKRDLEGNTCARLLMVVAGTLLVYCARDMPVVFLGWLASSLPLLVKFGNTEGVGSLKASPTRPAVMLLVSCGLLGIAVIILAITGNAGLAWSSDGSLRNIALMSAVAAGLIRSGIFPFHSWAVNSLAEDRSAVSLAVSIGMPGAFLIARLAAGQALGDTPVSFLPLVGDLALISTVLISIAALAEKNPRRLLAMVVTSQSGFIIGGLALHNVPGITGALLHWMVVGVSTPGLVLILRGLEARCGTATQAALAGLGARAPRLAAFFILFSLALVGLPGTLGFCAEDLLFHGALEIHPLLGFALPIATALNAIHLFRLFSNLFFGRHIRHVPAIYDSVPRERWVLSAMVLFLVGTGLMPNRIVQWRVTSAESIARVVEKAAATP
jgi:NADH-quinone oxidoreductase subunit M